MNRTDRVGFFEFLRKVPQARLSWTWLAVGFALLPFTAWQSVVPLAGWLAPVFLLRFSRTALRGRLARLLVSFAYMAGALIASRGTPFNLLGLVGNIILKGAVYSLPYAFDRILARRSPGLTRSLAFPLAFTVIDWVLSLLKLTSSGSPAYSQFGSLALIQLLSVTGMSGVTFLVTWFASTVNELWEQGFRLRNRAVLIGVYGGVLAAALVFGVVRLNLAASPMEKVSAATLSINAETVDRAVRGIDWVHTDFASDRERASLKTRLAPTVEEMLAKTETALRGGAKIVGWQESSGWMLEEDRQAVVARVAEQAKQHDAYVQIGVEVFTRAAKIPVLRNESILIDPFGRIAWIYDKTNPVPFDEAFATIPGTGTLPSADTRYGRMSTAICYDTYFPSLIRQAGRQGADILLAPFNDSKVFASYFLAIATYRAIENGFAMLRPTGNGISAIIDRFGRVVASQSSFGNTGGIMIADLPLNGVRTIYSRIGDLFAYLCVAALVILAAAGVVRSRKPAAAPALP